MNQEFIPRTPDHILDQLVKDEIILIKEYTSKIKYKFLGWDEKIYEKISYSEATSMETDSLLIPSFTEFFRISENDYKKLNFINGYYWGREIYSNSDLIAYGYNVTFRYKCLFYIPEKLANLRLIKVEKEKIE